MKESFVFVYDRHLSLQHWFREQKVPDTFFGSSITAQIENFLLSALKIEYNFPPSGCSDPKTSLPPENTSISMFSKK